MGDWKDGVSIQNGRAAYMTTTRYNGFEIATGTNVAGGWFAIAWLWGTPPRSKIMTEHHDTEDDATETMKDMIDKGD